ncbi:aspartate aminotransferase family protein [Streptomyces sp. NPDC090052]|uniref:aminotransferase family protein n=1 Tax=unclassified Streptomyces TaxID=2593676 RepID=UPI002253C9B4|nr:MULTISPECIES: aspartate aminotransferase family protein [unclassified Streptomyces]MCX4723148.1 aspartate aminotransferase family protein [Streptomyces sp. NBC_01306]WSV07219.1 aspartate aminotransferase family protein [Streptomyces sp. NBC_01020]WSX45336.1 aspartate aminotransferase family protein [Streptomyces sp. NBC_00963]WSX66642.1 aspartate aminotransferase family protein [Streptomyces sp. NBC_00932]
MPFSHAELAATDRAHIIHPYLPGTAEERVVMTGGSGCRLTDAEGRSYLDATGGLWLAQIGHGREEVAQVAFDQMKQLEYFTSFWEFSNDKAVALAARLASLAPAGLDHVYFTSGGSEGNEAAIKMARYYHHRRGDTDRTWILARDKAYHGIGYGGGSATGFPVYHEGFAPMMPHVSHLTPPWPYRTELYGGQDPTDFLIGELEARIAEIGPGNIAAMIGEPIMGVGGMLVPPADYWPRVREVLDRHGILLIFDEVVTAYGRVGEWFAAQHFGVTPDIIVTAKGITSGYIPLGALLVADRVAEVLLRDHGFPMGYTYNGHPVAAAVALANLDIIEREGLLGRAVTMGARLHAELDAQLGQLPIVGEIRSVGMMLAVELVADRGTRAPLPLDPARMPHDVIRRETGVIVRDSAHSLVLSPPLIMTDAEAKEAAVALRSVLERTLPTGEVQA